MRDGAGLRIVVLGGGTAGWMAACLLAARWGERCAITVIESPEIGIIGVGEGSTPQLKVFFDDLGIDERDWMARCNATYKTGIVFRDWSKRPGAASEYFHPFPAQPDDHASPAFVHAAAGRRAGFDLDAHPDGYFLGATLAKKRLAPLPARNFPFLITYGYHFDSHLLGAFLREHAQTRGVTHVAATVAEVERAETGDVAALRTHDGRRFAADVFVDSSGFRSLLVQDALKVPFVSFADTLFNDAAVTLPTPPERQGPKVCTTATALKHGWAWDIPLTTRTGNGYVYSSAYCSPEAAEAELRAHLGVGPEVEARHLRMKCGRVERHWANNCLAVGLSQGFIEPLEATALHLVYNTVQGFIAHYETGGFTNAKADTFNAVINRRYEGVRDYIVAHYRVSDREDTEYWRRNATNPVIPQNLRAVLAAWLEGRNVAEDVRRLDIDHYYSPLSWGCLLAGYGLFPDPKTLKPATADQRRYDTAVIADFMERCALNFPSHAQALADLAPLAASG